MQDELKILKNILVFMAVLMFALGGVVFAWPTKNWLYCLLIAILLIFGTVCTLVFNAACIKIDKDFRFWRKIL